MTNNTEPDACHLSHSGSTGLVEMIRNVGLRVFVMLKV